MAAPALSPGRERLAFVSQVLQGYQVEVQVGPFRTNEKQNQGRQKKKQKKTVAEKDNSVLLSDRITRTPSPHYPFGWRDTRAL